MYLSTISSDASGLRENMAAGRRGRSAGARLPGLRGVNEIEASQRVLKRFVIKFGVAGLGKS
jgi:hypothetical protein